MHAFGERLRTLRCQRGLRQAQVADMLTVSPRVYNRWERGAAVPRLDTLVKLADILQVTLDELGGRLARKTPDLRVRHPKLRDLYRELDRLSADDQHALVVLLESLLKRSELTPVAIPDVG
jgi:transcriptional regulator with XRE-family HTH domain